MRKVTNFYEQTLFLEDIEKIMDNINKNIKSTFNIFTDGSFTLFDGTQGLTTSFFLSSTDGSSVSVGFGLGYKNGERIKVCTNELYDLDNINRLIDGICVPKSTGNIGVPITEGITNYFWIDHTPIYNENYTSNHPITGLTHYTMELDGYKIITDTDLPLVDEGMTLNYLYLGEMLSDDVGFTMYTSGKRYVSSKF